MLYVDTKFANLLSVQLERFKVKTFNPYLANCRCPICGDSQKNKNRARGYLYSKSNSIFYKCHNCGVGISFGNLLKQLNPSLYNQYKLERYKEGLDLGNAPKPHAKVEFEFEEPKFKERSLLDKMMDRLDQLPDYNPAVKYAVERMIPRDKFDQLYYIDDVSKIENLAESYRNKIKGKKPRLVIPFYNSKGKLIGLTCRALGDEKLRYITIHIDKSHPMIYNLDKIDTTKTIYCVEGPLDSLFIPNSVAVGTSDLKKVRGILPKDKTVLIFDNQPRNKEIVKLMRKAMNDGWSLVVWPDNVGEKDINDMVKDGFTPEEILSVINKSTFSDLRLRIKINQWSKV